MKKAICKFFCASVATHSYPGKTVVLQTQYDPNLPEDQRFHQATPAGSLEALICNPALEGFFEPGKSYYVEITAAEPEK